MTRKPARQCGATTPSWTIWWHADLADLHEDFWLYDSTTVVGMVYDEAGHFLYPEQRGDTQHYLGLRDRALRHAILLDDYLRKYEPDLLADPL